MAKSKRPAQTSKSSPRRLLEDAEEPEGAEFSPAQRDERESFKGLEPGFADMARLPDAPLPDLTAHGAAATRAKTHTQILEFLEEFRKATVNIVFAGIVLLLALTVIRAIQADELAIDAISLPKNIKEMGYTEEGAAQAVADKMRIIVQESRAHGGLLNARTGGEDADIAVPVAGISFTTAIRLARQIAGFPQRHVSGEMVCAADNCSSKELELRLRLTDGSKVTALLDRIRGTSPDQLLKTGAEELIRSEDPMSLAVYLYGAGPDDNARRDEALNIAGIFAAEDGPDKALAENLLGISFVDKPGDETADLETAITHFNAALQADASFSPALSNRGMAQGTLKLFADAAASYRQSITLNPGNADARRGLALVLRDEGKLDEAIAELQAALAINGRDAKSYNVWASIVKNRGNVSEAVGLYGKAILQDPGNADYVFNLALAYRAMGNKPEAKRAFETYLVMAPQASDAADVKMWIEELK